ncbi:hypothetical protein GF340_02890 [Candidatus Peregrinibacteria bacterium]|nr:hypothetical protein [Candidatus Peregrinibacteria bacterium]
MEAHKENQIIQTVILRDGHTEPTIKEIGTTFPDVLSFIDYLPGLEKYLEDLKKTYSDPEYAELTAILHRTINEYINNIAVSKIVFGILNDMRQIAKGKHKCVTTVFIENIDEVLQKMSEYEENIKSTLNAMEFMHEIPGRIVELHKKIEDKRQELTQLKAERNQIITNSRQGVEDDESVARMKQLLADRKDLERDIDRFANEVELLQDAEQKLKVIAVICLDQPMAFKKQLAELLIPFDRTTSKTNISADIKNALIQQKKTCEFFTEDPHAIKSEQIEGQIRNKEIKHIAAGNNRKVHILLGFAAAAVITASAAAGFYYLNERSDNGGQKIDGDKTADQDSDKKEFIEMLSKKPINHLEVSILKPRQEGKSWLRFRVIPGSDLQEKVKEIYGKEVVITFRTINPVTKKMREEDVLEMQFNALCKEGRQAPVLLIHPKEGETIEIKLDMPVLRQKCEVAKKEMMEAGYRITVDGNESTHFIQLEENSEATNESLQKAKNDLRAFINHNQKLGKIGYEVPTDFIDGAAGKQVLEKQFIEAMGQEAVSIRRASPVRTDFYINPMLKEGLQTIHGFVLSGLMDKSDKKEIFSTHAIHQGFGQADSIVCGRESDFLGIVVQPGKERNQKTRIFYPYDLNSWQTTNCEKK